MPVQALPPQSVFSLLCLGPNCMGQSVEGGMSGRAALLQISGKCMQSQRLPFFSVWLKSCWIFGCFLFNINFSLLPVKDEFFCHSLCVWLSAFFEAVFCQSHFFKQAFK